MFNLKNYKSDEFIIILVSILPISILFGNFLINFTIVTIGTIFLTKLLIRKSDYFNLKGKYTLLLLLLFFFLSLTVNLIFSNNIILSYQRVLKFFFVIFFILAFNHLIINHSNNLKKIYKFWSIIFIIVVIDIIIEFFIGKNIIGYETKMPGRLGSFTGEESVIGYYFFGFCLIFLSSAYIKSKNNLFNIFLAIFLIVISFIIGERANFIKTILAIFIFMFFVYKIEYKIKFFSVILAFILLYFIFLNLDSGYKNRYLSQIKTLFTKNGLSTYLENSKYGAHRNVAKEIFLDNPIFGVGIKNFRNESGKKKYDNLDHKENQKRASTHPHELYYEFLSEKGIFGLTCFLIFILSSIFLSLKNYLREKNIYQFSAIIIISISILPIIPTGSFLSTYTSSIFWINYGIMMGYCYTKKTKY